MGLLDGIFGNSPQAPVGGAAQSTPPVSGTGSGLPAQPDYQKMMLAQALMGGGSAPANSFAGGLAQGISPMLRMMLAQKMGLMPSQQQAPSALPIQTPQPGMFQNAPPSAI